MESPFDYRKTDFLKRLEAHITTETELILWENKLADDIKRQREELEQKKQAVIDAQRLENFLDKIPIYILAVQVEKSLQRRVMHALNRKFGATSEHEQVLLMDKLLAARNGDDIIVLSIPNISTIGARVLVKAIKEYKNYVAQLSIINRHNVVDDWLKDGR